MKVDLSTVGRVEALVKCLEHFEGVDFDLVRGSITIDAKSIMGVHIMDLSKPCELVIHCDDSEKGRVIEAIQNALSVK